MSAPPRLIAVLAVTWSLLAVPAAASTNSPSTYVAAYPSTYVASYPSTYVASYPSTYVASYPSTYVASYPTYTASYAPTVSYASPCSTCVQQVTMRPVCETCPTPCDPCASCAVGSTYGVSQTSYEQPSGCATCGAVVTPGSQQGAPANGTAQPELEPSVEVGPRSTYQQRPVNGEQPPVEPEPGTDTDDGDLESGFQGEKAESSDGSTFFEAPELFNPKDRTAQRHIAPVRTALYEQPVEYRRASTVRTKITAQQAAQDAVGWTSVSN